ncbi:phosphoribosylglycinamide formyltransferase [Lapidilactobacillus dextrinicus DSM 20335]|uniref:Phosphoribosylglycinamide formyltransferase n=1 Tax=Lapidilactobacillus dextrinicus DSM 20335 TaxID=1423738 RepID=A0A0R2BQK5_9LACO|nr:phosphoribosylglycinamide formyltransferase [Lapidilactobacillus dextrinicus]KRM78427.1 phosphoribosylglycinamide formyltransferase [Lapidilactobacillus dextrinicus DSM 20335]QFG47229.1 phosphoribosylglycinamide formyltransferase [Lapidilactobacillus dextrinicus]
MVKTTRLAVMASGTGTNFSALMAAIKTQNLPIQIVRVVVDHANAPVIQRAAAENVPVLVVSYQNGKAAAEAKILAQLATDKVAGIILAGYMRILSADFVQQYPQRIINLHPALLPSFPGRRGIEDAYHYGVKMTGVTVHFVNAGVDSGEIIAQAAVPIDEGESLAALEAQIHQVEHQLYPATIKKLVEKGVFEK